MKKQIYVHWFLLMLMAGCINAAGLLACTRFVTHVTGSSTLVGVSLASGKWLQFVEALSIPLSFFCGVVVAGYHSTRSIRLNQNLGYQRVLILVAICLGLVAFGGHFQIFSQLQNFSKFKLDELFLIAGLLAFSSGLQNGVVTAFSKATVRTTHVTGLLTDLGLDLARFFSASPESEPSKKERKQALTRFAFLFTFILGSLLGALFYMKFGYLSFLIPSLISMGLVISFKRLNWRFNLSEGKRRHPSFKNQPLSVT